MDEMEAATRDTTAESPEAPAPEITKAWGKLWAWACGQRLDWDEAAVKLAMREAANREADYHDAAVILWRLAWDLKAGTSQVLGELSYLNRTGSSPKGDPPPDVSAAIKARDYAAARKLTGGTSVVPEVPGQGAAAATENDHQEAGR